jgi:hypothetical protein
MRCVPRLSRRLSVLPISRTGTPAAAGTPRGYSRTPCGRRYPPGVLPYLPFGRRYAPGVLTPRRVLYGTRLGSLRSQVFAQLGSLGVSVDTALVNAMFGTLAKVGNVGLVLSIVDELPCVQRAPNVCVDACVRCHTDRIGPNTVESPFRSTVQYCNLCTTG